MAVGIQETVEVLDFLAALLEDAGKASNDGDGLTTIEVIKLGISNAPAAVRAAIGAGEVMAECKDLDRAEMEVVTEKCLAMAKAIMALFSGPAR